MDTKNHNALLDLISSQESKMSRIYANMAKDLASVLRRYRVHNNSKLWFKNAVIKKDVDLVLARYSTIIYNNIEANAKLAWELADIHNDKFIKQYTSGINVPKAESALYYARNTEALNAFIKRGKQGFTLSDRIWRLEGQTREQLETFIAEGLTTGRSAPKLANDLKQFLKNSDKRFRRIHDPKTGKLKISVPAKDYHPGRGVYRSSYKNALRLARTEVNIAYRTSDFERRGNLPFVLGIEVHLSNAHPVYDICDELQGEYPKGFKFTGWHSACLCYTTAKLLPKSEFKKYLNGQAIDQKRYVRTIPNRAALYLNDNYKKINGLSNTPYFIADNFKNSSGKFLLKENIGENIKILRLTESDIVSNLRNSGVVVNYSDKGLEQFRLKSPDFNLNRLFGTLETQLALSGIKNVKKKVYFNNSGFNFKLYARNFEMIREVHYQNGFNDVYHSYLRVPKSKQGAGLTRKMFQALVKEYEAGNIQKISVTANIDVGGYAWAKYGFSATKKADVLEIINASKNTEFKRKALKKVKYFYDKYGDDKPFPMIRLANIEGGKDELLNTWWSGEIDLTDNNQRKLFMNYLYK